VRAAPDSCSGLSARPALRRTRTSSDSYVSRFARPTEGTRRPFLSGTLTRHGLRPGMPRFAATVYVDAGPGRNLRMFPRSLQAMRGPGASRPPTRTNAHSGKKSTLGVGKKSTLGVV
jgi:hypothetical protein